MKRKRLLCSLLIMILMITSVNLQVYAENGLNVTRAYMGDNNTTEIVRVTRNVVNIEDGAFSGLTELKTIIVDNDNKYYASYDGCLYNKDFTVLICIPQNTNDRPVNIKGTITSYTPHALDGISQSRKDTLNKYLGINTNVIETTKIPEQEKDISKTIQSEQSETKTIDTKKTTDFSQYVYTDEYGQVRFNYTGKGDKRIIVPEGVDIIEGMAEPSWDDANYDVEYIYIPSSVKWIYGEVIFEFVDGDDNWYNVFYRCRNLKKVEVSKDNEDFKTNKKGTVLYNYRGFKRGWEKDWQYNKRIVMGD